MWALSTKDLLGGEKHRAGWAGGAERTENILDPSQAGALDGSRMAVCGCVLLLRTGWKAGW